MPKPPLGIGFGGGRILGKPQWRASHTPRNSFAALPAGGPYAPVASCHVITFSKRNVTCPWQFYIHARLHRPVPDSPYLARWPPSCSGSVQALALGAGLLFFTTKMEGVIAGSQLPDAYTVRQLLRRAVPVLQGAAAPVRTHTPQHCCMPLHPDAGPTACKSSIWQPAQPRLPPCACCACTGHLVEHVWEPPAAARPSGG